jgi:hypothetical protein
LPALPFFEFGPGKGFLSAGEEEVPGYNASSNRIEIGFILKELRNPEGAKCSTYTISKARTTKDTTDPKSSAPPTNIAHLSIPIFPFVLFIPLPPNLK